MAGFGESAVHNGSVYVGLNPQTVAKGAEMLEVQIFNSALFLSWFLKFIVLLSIKLFFS